MKSIPEWEDGFGRPITQTVNPLDMPSSYPASAERYRFYVNGSRTRIGETEKISDRKSDILVEPAAGDTIRVRSAERIRYIVGYEGLASWAWQALTQLGEGDRVTVGLSDTEGNGYVVEYLGTGPNADDYTATASIESATAGTVAESSFDPPVDPTTMQRDAIQWNWYNVGRAVFRKTHTESGSQRTPTVATLSNDAGRASDAANLYLVMEIEAATSGQQLAVGSVGHIVLGNSTPTSRGKSGGYDGLGYGSSGDYEPLCAFRIDPSRDNVNVAIEKIETLGHTEDGEVVLVCVDPSLTDASGFATPPQINSDNSVVEGTESITTYPDSSYTEVASAPSHGGRQVGQVSTTGSGDLSGGTRASEAFGRKRTVYPDDIVVVLLKTISGNTDSDLSVRLGFEEEW